MTDQKAARLRTLQKRTAAKRRRQLQQEQDRRNRAYEQRKVMAM